MPESQVNNATAGLALEMRGVTKRFPGVLANDQVDFQLRKGEIHALLGENGAGKSTLMNILYGLYTPDEGKTYLDGKDVTIHCPSDAIAHGIGMVHQHFMLIPVMTVAENITLGQEVTKAGVFLDPKAGQAAHRRALRAIRLRGRSRRAGGRPAGGRAAAGGDHQGALSPRRHPDPG